MIKTTIGVPLVSCQLCLWCYVNPSNLFPPVIVSQTGFKIQYNPFSTPFLGSERPVQDFIVQALVDSVKKALFTPLGSERAGYNQTLCSRSKRRNARQVLHSETVSAHQSRVNLRGLHPIGIESQRAGRECKNTRAESNQRVSSTRSPALQAAPSVRHWICPKSFS